MSLKIDLLEKVRKALFRSEGAAEEVRAPSEADFLVKMNIPPLLGRRDAICEYLQERLRPEIKDLELSERLVFYRDVLDTLDSALNDTDSVAMMLSSEETAGRERRVSIFLETLRNLLSSAQAMAEASSAFIAREQELGYFLNKAGKLSRYAASGQDSEMRSLNLALDLGVAATAKFGVYRDYNRKSFSTANAARYQAAFDTCLKSLRLRTPVRLPLEKTSLMQN